MSDTFASAAYGGDNWSPRTSSHGEEIGTLWAHCGIADEWSCLESVLLHRPGKELEVSCGDHDAIQMLAPLDLARAREEHDRMAQAYRDHQVEVFNFDHSATPSPNQMFCADLFAMTPQGAILARPASSVRAGEERYVARRLAELGIPILRTLTGNATFEGADLIWVDSRLALLGIGLRTNREAAQQISALLGEIGVELVALDMPFGTMHLMGMLRIVDRDLAIAWPRRTPHGAVMALRERGYRVVFLPDQQEAEEGRAFNFVTLGPRKILTAAGNPVCSRFYESLGVECVQTSVAELAKAAGAVGCLTGILSRETTAG